MVELQKTHHPQVPSSLRHEVGFAATACGLLAAVGYMSANICLRSVTHLDPTWVTCVKAVPTVVAIGPLLALRVVNRQLLFSSPRALWTTIAVAIVSQIAGNVCFQWSLGVVGLALAVPLTLGAMIASGALLGRWLLQDRVTFRITIASAVLILAIFILSLGAPAANAAVARSADRGQLSQPWILLGVVAACMSGVAYSLLNVSLRYSSNQGTPQSSLLFTVGLVGVILLGAISYARDGWTPPTETTSRDWIWLIGAGVCNVLAFWALTKALHLSSVVFVNALNASQTAMAAVAGVLLFQEPVTAPMGIGVAFTAVGLMMMRKGQVRNPAKVIKTSRDEETQDKNGPSYGRVNP